MEDNSRDLATALTPFQKSPGRDDKWVEKVITTMEQAWPDEYVKLGRLTSFSAKLSDITQFRDAERAAAVVGVFFQVVSSAEIEDGPPASQAWVEYFTNNIGAFEAAFDVVRGLRSNDADGWGGPASAVARIAVLFENESKSRRRGPLQLLHTLREEADTPVMERVVEALWTEEGQELCSQSSRAARLRGPELAALVTDNLKLLKGAPARARAATPEVGVGGGPLSAPIRSSTKRGASELVASLASATSERKKALRASLIPEESAREEAELNESEPNTPEQEALAALVTSIDGKKARQKASDELDETFEADDEVLPEPEREPERELARAELEPTDQTEQQQEASQDVWQESARREPTPFKKEAAIMQNNGQDGAVAEKLQALRQRLDRIERSATEAQELLTELGPQLDEVYSWVSELDAVLSRWTRPRAAI